MRDKRLVLLEASSENASLPQPGDRYGNRVSALTPATIQFLKGIIHYGEHRAFFYSVYADVDAWETICSTRMKSFRTMHVR